MICNQVDKVEVDPAPIEREEAEEICRNYMPSFRDKTEEQLESLFELLLDPLDAAELDEFVRNFKPADLSEIERKIMDALHEIFPQDEDTPRDKRHARRVNLHFVNSVAALRAAQGKNPQEPVADFVTMRDQLFRIIRRCASSTSLHLSRATNGVQTTT